MSGFHDAWKGRPPWDTGRAQPAVLELEDAGLIVDPVLDAGCGSGENALALAARGYTVTAIDLVPAAIERARVKAYDRKLDVDFLVGDALKLDEWIETYETVIDSALFHVFDDEDRKAYVRGLSRVVRPGGRVHIIVFSEEEPTDWGGPRRVAKHEFADAFANGWVVDAIVPTSYETNIHPDGGGRAWRATLRRAKPKAA